MDEAGENSRLQQRLKNAAKRAHKSGELMKRHFRDVYEMTTARHGGLWDWAEMVEAGSHVIRPKASPSRPSKKRKL